MVERDKWMSANRRRKAWMDVGMKISLVCVWGVCFRVLAGQDERCASVRRVVEKKTRLVSVNNGESVFNRQIQRTERGK